LQPSIQKEFLTLDLGTTKFCIGYLAIPEDWQNESAICHFQFAPSAGFKKGMLVEFAEAKQKLAPLIQQAETRLGRAIDSVVLGISGSHLSSRIVTIQENLAGAKIDATVLAKMRTKAERRPSLNKDIIHVIPIYYQIDQRPSGDSPLGLSGEQIMGSFLVIEADSFYLRDIVHLCNEVGLEVSRLYCEAFASSQVISNVEQKQQGCVILDIGGGSSDGIVYHLGKPKGIFTANIGGQHMTGDISIGLNLPWHEAEQVKTFFCLNHLAEKEAVIAVRNIHGESKNITMAQVYPILVPRLEELVNQVNSRIHPIKASLKGGILLTGGGSRLEGICEIFTRLSGLETRTYQPQFPKLDAKKSLLIPNQDYSGVYATSLGMLALETEMADLQSVQNQGKTKTRYLRRFLNLLKELS
jgi:cell division protein FtsA